jgi:hypothetical protein
VTPATAATVYLQLAARDGLTPLLAGPFRPIVPYDWARYLP